MSRCPARATQADMARALRAVEQTGARVRIDVRHDGTISFVPIGPEDDRARLQTPDIAPEREIVL
jgi:hypothetical protein